MVNSAPDFYKILVSKYSYTPTINQDILLQELANFVFSEDTRPVFILKGYAGTGKTSSMRTFVQSLWHTGQKSVLLAPTGRAAKVLSVHTSRKANTIHKQIYQPKKNKSGAIHFVRQVNKNTNTVFVVDEASMIADQAAIYGQNSLLEDLMDYVFSGKKNKLIFIGDTAQLPPVKYELSPALERDVLSYKFDADISSIEMDQVVRQDGDSGILHNATEIRSILSDAFSRDFHFELGFKDIVLLEDGYDIQDALVSSYDNDDGVENTVFVVRSNKRANQYNAQIRSKIRGEDGELSAGDYIMVVKNNYHWLPSGSEAGFIANGDICEILEIYNFKELYGFRFAEVKIRMIDYPNQNPFETVVILDTLTSESPSLNYEQSNMLYQEVLKDYSHISAKYKQLQEVKKNKYFNALQIKFSYAITCHKSQGGQWQNVFIEKPYLPDGQSVPYLRWLYTALTRAQKRVYLIGFKSEDYIE